MDLWKYFLDSLRLEGSFLDFAREMDISRAMALSPLQDPLRFRARFLGLEVAEMVVEGRLAELIERFEKGIYLIGPNLENDALFFEHILNSLRFLADNEEAKLLLKRFSPPLCHAGADRLVRETLWPRSPKKIQDTDIQKAVLAALFTWLRQTTGSCFATAPAILVQQEQPLRFLQDLFDLLTFGSLKRVVAGKEYSVPLCPSREMADLLRPLGTADLSFSPGLRAAFAAAGLKGIHRIEEAQTPKELIELSVMKSLGLEPQDIKDEEALKKIDMNPMLAKQTAVYYQRPSERNKKVTEWKEKTSAACTAYQALGDCALLRSWEATLASFSDVKVDVGRWNLYTSLGMHPDQPGGIGAFLYERINIRLQEVNLHLQSVASEYENARQIARNAERMGSQSEHASAMYAVNSLVEQSKMLSKEAEQISTLLAYMINGYDRLIPESFQEIFDPSLAQNLSDMIDDSPAGFRLAYKHGRTTTSQWSFIRTQDEFIAALREFFGYAERELSLERDRSLIERLSTELIQFIQTDEFMAGVLARAKKNPAMQGSLAKPWEYISGGTMPGLMMVYCNRSEPFTALKRKIQNEEDLLSFLIEAKSDARMLMHSPTHAFIFRPDWLPSDISDALTQMRHFWQKIQLREVNFLAEKFSSWLPVQERIQFMHNWTRKGAPTNFAIFRLALIQSLSRPDPETLVDSFLYESLPLIDRATAIEIGADKEMFADAPFFTPVEVKERLKALSLSRATSPLFREDIDSAIAATLRSRGLAAPAPVLFADTNWSAGFFGLAISPNGALNLWRFQRTGMSGAPMRAWFDLQRNGSWLILTNPQEYR